MHGNFPLGEITESALAAGRAAVWTEWKGVQELPGEFLAHMQLGSGIKQGLFGLVKIANLRKSSIS